MLKTGALEILSSLQAMDAIQEAHGVTVGLPSPDIEIFSIMPNLAEHFGGFPFNANTYYCGALTCGHGMFLSDAYSPFQETLASLHKAKETGKRLVYLSMGTLGAHFGDRLADFVHHIFQMANGIWGSQSGWEVVIAAGKEGKARLAAEELSPNIRVFDSVPQVAVLHLADVFITHGGNNSVMEALALGVPMVVIPTLAKDQLHAAAAVESMGFGLAFHGQEGVTDLRKCPERQGLDNAALASAVEKLVTDSSYRDKCAEMRVVQNKAGGAEGAARLVAAALGG